MELAGCVYSDDQGSKRKHNNYFGEAEKSSDELFEIELGIEVRSNRRSQDEDEDDDDCEESWFSFDFRNKSNHCVYVGIDIDNIDSSMNALQWTLEFSVLPSSIVYLLHVFPKIRFIPSPLGMLPKSQVSPKLVEKFMAEERAKRSEFLHKLVDTCSAAAAQVKVEVVMIESDMVAKAILDLISLLHIRKLILGSTKARRKWKSKREKGVARQVLQYADEFCEVKIICEGMESTDQMTESSSSPSSSSHTPSSPNFNTSFKNMKKDYRHGGFLSWRCFGG